MFLNRIALSVCLLIGFTCVSAQVQAANDEAVKLRFSLNNKSADEPVTVTVSGKVLDKSSGQPIPGAQVRGFMFLGRNQGPDQFAKCPQLETKAGAAGQYRLVFQRPLTTSGMRKGEDEIFVKAGAPGYATFPLWVKGHVSQARNNFPDFDLALDPGKLIKGIVVDEDHRPIPHAIVRIQQTLSSAWEYCDALGRTQTDGNGAFEIRCSTNHDVHWDKPWLLIVAPGYGIGYAFGILDKGDLGTVVVPRGGEVAGRVVDAQGQGISNCEVSMFGFPEDPIKPVHTDSEGRYVFRGVFGLPTLQDFFIKKNGNESPVLAVRKIFARLDPSASLQDAPTCEVTAQCGKTVAAPDLAFNTPASVVGRLIQSKSPFTLKGLLVRLDYDWGRMVEADSEGKFAFPSVPAGKHRFTAYLPTNLRGDRGIGGIELDIQPQQKIGDAKIQLEELAEARVQILDARGNPLEGITAGATSTKDGSGFWTEGTRSGPDGWSVLYLYPGGPQYVRGFDMNNHKLLAGDFVEVSPKAGEVINNLRVTMVEPASIAGNAQETGGKPVAERKLLLAFHYADGTERSERITTDKNGIFQIEQVKPGAVRLTLTTDPKGLFGKMDKLIEIKPGEVRDIGDIALHTIKPEEDREQIPLLKHKEALAHPEIIKEQAQKILNAIRTADYQRDWLGDDAWQHFLPDDIDYQVYTDFPSWVKWICKTFSANPIQSVELGEVFASNVPEIGKTNLPTIRYKLTLKDGKVLQGELPFYYDVERKSWCGAQGLDWHLKAQGQKAADLKDVKLDSKEGLMALVEDFFKSNYHDITSRKTLEWGEPVKEQNGTFSIRYKAETLIWDRDQRILNKVFTFDPNGKFVSVKDATDPATPGNQ